MQNYILFVEGNTEAVFIRRLLELKFAFRADVIINNLGPDYNIDRRHNFVANRKAENPDVGVKMYIAGGDGGVITALENHWSGIKDKNATILCLRDLYCEEYVKRAGHKVDKETSEKMMNTMKETVKKITDNSNNVYIRFAIMEIEAWLLQMKRVIIQAANATEENFDKVIDISSTDPQSMIKPKKHLKEVYTDYDTSISCLEGIMSHVKLKDLEDMYNNKNVAAFTEFYDCFNS